MKIIFPRSDTCPIQAGTWILDLSHDPIWAIWLVEVSKFHQHHDRIVHYRYIRWASWRQQQRKHQRSALLCLLWIHLGRLESPHKGTVTRKVFTCHIAIMYIPRQSRQHSFDDKRYVIVWIVKESPHIGIHYSSHNNAEPGTCTGVLRVSPKFMDVHPYFSCP